ncbi:MAG: hypothetical protein CL912_13210 [Deltaproteobacteria bacterium]|nr:hypothetical protein [Deltaproteobacteria bacterium]|tara:strand:- start:322 stop:594 length:273 start_codon:yes stop_codon:yes gene_type:complete
MKNRAARKALFAADLDSEHDCGDIDVEDPLCHEMFDWTISEPTSDPEYHSSTWVLAYDEIEIDEEDHDSTDDDEWSHHDMNDEQYSEDSE